MSVFLTSFRLLFLIGSICHSSEQFRKVAQGSALEHLTDYIGYALATQNGQRRHAADHLSEESLVSEALQGLDELRRDSFRSLAQSRSLLIETLLFDLELMLVDLALTLQLGTGDLVESFLRLELGFTPLDIALEYAYPSRHLAWPYRDVYRRQIVESPVFL